MGTRTTAKKTKRVGITLFFDGPRFVAKLVKRVKDGRYASAGGVVERAFEDVFGTYEHKHGSPMWAKDGATVDQANLISARLSLHDEYIDVAYTRPAAHDPAEHGVAIQALKDELETPLGRGLIPEAKELQERIERLEKDLETARTRLASNRARRSALEKTIAALGG